jgi:3-phenylpropionate/cinnamic acid dioxygenase small subunit
MYAAVQRLLDEAAIRDVVHRYARGVDRCDWELVRACFHPDGIDDHGRYRGDVEGFITWLQETLDRFVSASHLIGNVLIEVDGDTAWAESYCWALHRVKADDAGVVRDHLVNARYCDRFERRDGEWKIAERVAVFEPGRNDVVVEDVPPGALGVAGTRGPDDFSYRR